MGKEELLEEIKRKTQELSNPSGIDSASSTSLFHSQDKSEIRELPSLAEFDLEKGNSKESRKEVDKNKQKIGDYDTANLHKNNSFVTSATEGFLKPTIAIQEILHKKVEEKTIDKIKTSGNLIIFPRFRANFVSNDDSANEETNTLLNIFSEPKKENTMFKEELFPFDVENIPQPENREAKTEEQEHLLSKKEVLSNSEHWKKNPSKRKNTHKHFFLMFLLFLFYTFLGTVIIFFTLRFIEKKSLFYLSREDITLTPHSSYQAEVIVDKKIVNNENYEWTSSDPSIAMVNENGILTAVSNGNATITVKSKATNQEKEFTVNIVNIAVTSIEFKQKRITLKPKEEMTLLPIINGDENIIANLSWRSDNEKVIQVDQNGHILAIESGEANISVYDKESNLSATIAITVKKNIKPSNSKPTAVSSIFLNKTNATMGIGEVLNVSATIYPNNATNKEIIWSSNNLDVATVENGNITALKEGIAIITATTKDGNKTATIQIIVQNIPPTIPVTEIHLNITELTLAVGESEVITANVFPTNATNKDVEWKIDASNDSITVMKSTNSVTITAKKPGSSILTASSSDGKYKATCIIQVKQEKEDHTNSSENQDSEPNKKKQD